jgi:hypothetical protein
MKYLPATFVLIFVVFCFSQDTDPPDNDYTLTVDSVQYHSIYFKFKDLNQIDSADAVYLGIWLDTGYCADSSDQPFRIYLIDTMDEATQYVLPTFIPGNLHFLSYSVADQSGSSPNNWAVHKFGGNICTSIVIPALFPPENDAEWSVSVPAEPAGVHAFNIRFTRENSPFPVYSVIDVYVSRNKTDYVLPQNAYGSMDTVYRIFPPYLGDHVFGGLDYNTRYYVGIAPVDTQYNSWAQSWGSHGIDSFTTLMSCTEHSSPSNLFSKFDLVVNSSSRMTLDWSMRDTTEYDSIAMWVNQTQESAIESLSFWYRTSISSVPTAPSKPAEQAGDLKLYSGPYFRGLINRANEITGLEHGTNVAIAGFIKDRIAVSTCIRPWVRCTTRIAQTTSLPQNVIEIDTVIVTGNSAEVRWSITNNDYYDLMKIMWSVGDNAYPAVYNAIGYHDTLVAVTPATQYSLVLSGLYYNKSYSLGGFIRRASDSLWSEDFVNAQSTFTTDASGYSGPAPANLSRISLVQIGPSTVERTVVDESGVAGDRTGVLYELAHDSTRYFESSAYPAGFSVKVLPDPPDSYMDTVYELAPFIKLYFTVAVDSAGKDTLPLGNALDSITLSFDAYLDSGKFNFRIDGYNKVELIWNSQDIHQDFDSAGLAWAPQGQGAPALPSIKTGENALAQGRLYYFENSPAFETVLADSMVWYTYFGAEIMQGDSSKIFWSSALNLGKHAFADESPYITDFAFAQKVRQPADTAHHADLGFHLKDGDGDSVTVQLVYRLRSSDSIWLSFAESSYVGQAIVPGGIVLDTGQHAFTINLHENFNALAIDTIETDSLCLRLELKVYRDDRISVRESTQVIYSALSLDMRPPYNGRITDLNSKSSDSITAHVTAVGADSIRLHNDRGNLISQSWHGFDGDTVLFFPHPNLYVQFKDLMGNVDTTGAAYEQEYDTVIHYVPQDTLVAFGRSPYKLEISWKYSDNRVGYFDSLHVSTYTGIRDRITGELATRGLVAYKFYLMGDSIGYGYNPGTWPLDFGFGFTLNYEEDSTFSHEQKIRWYRYYPDGDSVVPLPTRRMYFEEYIVTHDQPDTQSNTISFRYQLEKNDTLIFFAMADTLILGIGNIPLTKMPKNFYCAQNTPNPFNPSTIIRYGIPQRANGKGLEIRIYNPQGRLIREYSAKNVMPGHYFLKWNGRDRQGSRVSGGVYFCEFRSDNYIKRLKMILLK